MQKILFLFSIIFLLIGCSTSSNNQEKILFITSNQHTYGTSQINASNHFGEIVLAYNTLVNAGYKVDFVSPNGGPIPIGYITTSNKIQKKYLYDANFMNLLKNTYKPKEINPINYKAVYYSGGGAAMFGVPENTEIQNITMQIYENNGVISAICHGTAGIVNLKTKKGKYIYKAKRICGFPDVFENKTAVYYQEFPFSIEEIIKRNGGSFEYSKKGGDNYYIMDERLITGQDQSATISVAEKIIETLKKQKNEFI